MDNERWIEIKSLFERVSELPLGEQAAFLERECGSDLELREQIDGMLAVDRDSPDFLASLGGAAQGLAAEPRAEPPAIGSIGPFHITRLIATGGMGVVYEAEQESPKRRVALKVLRAGLFDTSIHRRFLYETEILGRLRHPAIAQIHDAGVHHDSSGMDTPYFAMEYVAGGRDVISFAREEQLDLRGRIELFLEVCSAIHYGHQQGVIHRDIKPANLLVDEQGHAKVIDFGVARVTDADIARNSLVTRTGELIGTLRYMSPEQLSGDPAAIDTRSDVYSLGYVLYELLTEAEPYEVDGKSMTEVARIIRDVPPIHPRKVAPGLPLELGWVVLRALEKEKGRRYASANELAADLERFLADEPLVAGPPSAIYRMRKFVRRHRIAVGTLSLVALALITGGVMSTFGYVAAADEAQKFRSINGVLTDVLQSVQFDQDGRDVRVVELLDRAAAELDSNLDERPDVAAALHGTLAQSYLNLGLYQEARAQAERALQLWGPAPGGDVDARFTALDVLLSSLRDLGELEEFAALLQDSMREVDALGPGHWHVLRLQQLECLRLRDAGRFEEAEALARRTHQNSALAFGTDDDRTVQALDVWISCLGELEPTDELVTLRREHIALLTAKHGAEDPRVLKRKLALAALLHRRGELDASLALFEESLPPLTRAVGAEHSYVLLAMNDLANLHTRRREYPEAVSILQEVVRLREEHFGPEHPETLTARANLVSAKESSGDLSTTEEVRALLASQRRLRGPDHPRTLAALFNLGMHLVSSGELEEAFEVLSETLERSRSALGPDDELALKAVHALGYLRGVQQDYEAAEPLLREAWESYRRVYGKDAEATLRVAASYTAVLGRLGRVREALPVATEVLEAWRGRAQPGDAILAPMYTNLGTLHEKNGDLATAEGVFRQWAAEVDEHAATDAPQRAKAHDELAGTLRLRRKFDEARAEHELAIELGEFDLNVERAHYAHYRREYSRLLVELEEYDAAAEHLLIGLEALRGVTEPGEPYRIELTRELIGLFEHIEDEESAQHWRDELASETE